MKVKQRLFFHFHLSLKKNCQTACFWKELFLISCLKTFAGKEVLYVNLRLCASWIYTSWLFFFSPISTISFHKTLSTASKKTFEWLSKTNSIIEKSSIYAKAKRVHYISMISSLFIYASNSFAVYFLKTTQSAYFWNFYFFSCESLPINIRHLGSFIKKFFQYFLIVVYNLPTFLSLKYCFCGKIPRKHLMVTN